jgi:hypothetical protein
MGKYHDILIQSTIVKIGVKYLFGTERTVLQLLKLLFVHLLLATNFNTVESKTYTDQDVLKAWLHLVPKLNNCTFQTQK